MIKFLIFIYGIACLSLLIGLSPENKTSMITVIYYEFYLIISIAVFLYYKSIHPNIILNIFLMKGLIYFFVTGYLLLSGVQYNFNFTWVTFVCIYRLFCCQILFKIKMISKKIIS